MKDEQSNFINVYPVIFIFPDSGVKRCINPKFQISRELFEKMVSDAARDAKVRLKLVEARNQAPDHPVLWGADETYYLKFYIFQIAPDF